MLNLELGPDDVLTSQARLSNTGTQTLRVERLVSGTYLLPESVDTAHVLSGEWGNEFGIEPMNLTRGGIVVESRRNRTHDHFPGMLLSPANTSENAGEAWAVQLGWSGGHRLCVERMEDGRVRLSCGEYLYSGEEISRLAPSWSHRLPMPPIRPPGFPDAPGPSRPMRVATSCTGRAAR
ncbi:glycoside hydrolase family 36 N-terminal domain-containing protein [Azotobacter chroococcum]